MRTDAAKPANISANIRMANGVNRCPTPLQPNDPETTHKQAFALVLQAGAGQRECPAEPLVMKGSAVRIRSSAYGR